MLYKVINQDQQTIFSSKNVTEVTNYYIKNKKLLEKTGERISIRTEIK